MEQALSACSRQAPDITWLYAPLINPVALPSLDRRCSQFPDTPVIIDHLARIGAAEPINDAHVDSLCAMAKHANVMVKISAFYALGRKAPPYADLAPLIRRVYDAFGPERLMWASDCPFQVVDHAYEDSVGLIRDRLDFLSAADKEQILRKDRRGFLFSDLKKVVGIPCVGYYCAFFPSNNCFQQYLLSTGRSGIGVPSHKGGDREITPTNVGESVRLETAPTGYACRDQEIAPYSERAGRALEIAPTNVGASVRLETAPTGYACRDLEIAPTVSVQGRALEIAPTNVGESVRLETAPTGYACRDLEIAPTVSVQGAPWKSLLQMLEHRCGWKPHLPGTHVATWRSLLQ